MSNQLERVEKNGETINGIEKFEEKFFDTRKFKPKPNQIMARYRASAIFIDGYDKETVYDLLLSNPVGAKMAVSFMRNRIFATEESAVKLCREMCEDIYFRKSKEEIMSKEYKFTIEMFFYTEKENIPNDVHWDIIPIFSNHIIKNEKK